MKASHTHPVADVVPGLPPHELDERLRRASRFADVGHRAVAFYLADMHERGLCAAFGSPTTVAYAVETLDMSRRHARELLQAGLRLNELMAIDAAFAESRLAWSRVRRLCEVATPDTEAAWLERALTSTQDELDRQVRRARRGDLPPGQGGLPPARFSIRVEVDALRWQMWENVRAKLRAERGADAEDLRDEDLRDEDLLLEMMRLVLSSDADGSVPGRRPVDGEPYRVVVRAPEEVGGPRAEGARPGATAPTVETDDGLEQIGAAAFEAAAGDAAVSPKLRAKVLARDGHSCRHCGSRRSLHAHHAVWQSHGGRTVLPNLVTLCATCHDLVHEGFLDVEVAQYADPGRTAFVFRDADGRILGRRVLDGPRVSLRPSAAPAAPSVAQCATGGAVPARLHVRWLAQNLDRFQSVGGRLVAKAAHRQELARELGLPVRGWRIAPWVAGSRRDPWCSEPDRPPFNARRPSADAPGPRSRAR